MSMKQKMSSRLWALALMSCLLGWASPSPGQAATPLGEAMAWPGMGINSLLHYPSIKEVRDNLVHFEDGATLPYDDMQAKDFSKKLRQADIEDHFAQFYPAFAPINAPAPESDPGRFRNDALLKKLYGDSRKEVESNLVKVVWLPLHGGQRLLFNKKENAAAQLQKVSRELDRLPGEQRKYVAHVEGTYAYRPIAGADRLSPHSYGIAIDLALKHSCYWRWDKRHNYRNQIPKEVVDIFEKHGFIWGGRWYHYDTMHFEYRPEMFVEVR